MTRTIASATPTILSLAAALVTLTATAGTATAQTPPRLPTSRNAVYFELGGNAILYSLNYDRRLNDTWTGRAGLMAASVSATDERTGERANATIAIMPVMINALLGRGTHRLELGVGPLFAIGGGELDDPELGDVEEFSAAGLAGVTSTIGYRRQPADGGFVFRASLNPFYSGSAQIWAGLSVGWSF